MSDASQPLLRPWLLLLALLAAGVALATWNEWFWRADLMMYDAALPNAPASSDIVIVAVDDASIARIGRWPWRRALHAALLQRLREAGAKAVAFDLVLTEPDALQPDDDRLLASSMLAGPPTVLPLIVDWARGGMPLREILPYEPLAAAASQLAHVNLEIDRDGIARSVFLREGLGELNRSYIGLALLEAVPGLAPAALPGARRPAGPLTQDAWQRDYHMLIPFLGPAGHFQRLSYADVLTGKTAQDRLQGKLVLVGATAQGLGDAYVTPKSGQSVLMPGVEISANVVDALQSHRAINRLPPWWCFALSLVPLIAAFAGFLRLSSRDALLWIVALAVGTLLLSAVMLRFGNTWWPPAAALGALALSYPLWSWRRLEAAQHYLDQEFISFEREMKPLSLSAKPRRASLQLSDELQARIERVRAASTRMRHLRKILADTVAAVPDAIVLVDMQGRIALANPEAAELFGAVDPASLETTGIDHCLQMLGSPAPPSYRTLGEQAPTSLDLCHKDGRDLLLRVAAYHDANGQRSGTVIDIADVSRIKHAERERDDTIRFLSHDLRSPSSSLIGLAALLRDPTRSPPPVEVADRIESLARRSLSLADGFIALARAQLLVPTQFESFNLRDALQDAVDEVWAAAEARSILISIRCCENSSMVYGDRQMLSRALTNLLNNAVKFSVADSRVYTAIERRDLHWVVSVSDYGPGIAPEQQKQLFKRFSRAVHHGDTDPGGVGLGLAFVQAVAEKHGGRVSVASAAGRGATFSLELPRAVHQPPIEGASTSIT